MILIPQYAESLITHIAGIDPCNENQLSAFSVMLWQNNTPIAYFARNISHCNTEEDRRIVQEMVNEINNSGLPIKAYIP